MLHFLLPEPNSSSPPMFRNRFIDRFSRVHPASVPILYVPAVGVLLYWSLVRAGVSPLATVGLAAGGFVAWTLTEYWLHRCLFHWVPRAPWGRRMHFLLHGVHHDYPNDRLRLVMPTFVSVSLFWLFLGLYVLLFGRFAWAFHAGFVAGYIFYDMGHYYLHHFQPRWKWARAWKRHHMMHHAEKIAGDRKFGVSSTLWDHVFGTY
ncbi:MAG: sterol desaturase family protein [Myxococcota bacterium]|nr:sterol desaturase family protein [Myxococcota bacterium]MDW8363520.1 sterol desaturase family protein [Myxococcales bacterium]